MSGESQPGGKQLNHGDIMKNKDKSHRHYMDATLLSILWGSVFFLFLSCSSAPLSPSQDGKVLLSIKPRPVLNSTGSHTGKNLIERCRRLDALLTQIMIVKGEADDFAWGTAVKMMNLDYST